MTHLYNFVKTNINQYETEKVTEILKLELKKIENIADVSEDDIVKLQGIIYDCIPLPPFFDIGAYCGYEAFEVQLNNDNIIEQMIEAFQGHPPKIHENDETDE